MELKQQGEQPRRKFSKRHQEYKTLRTLIKNVSLASKSWNKCFGVGCNKTGTSTLDMVMSNLFGFRSNQTHLEIATTLQSLKGNLEPLKEQLQNYDFHQDLPISQGDLYLDLDYLFPNSKFILTVRDPEAWVNSFIRQYGNRIDGLAKNNDQLGLSNRLFPFPGYSHAWLRHYWGEEIQQHTIDLASPRSKKERRKHGKFSKKFKKMCIRKYKERNNKIFSYFKSRPNDLLVIDITKEKTINRLRDFLDIPPWFNTTFPRVNASQPANKKSVSFRRITVDFSKTTPANLLK